MPVEDIDFLLNNNDKDAYLFFVDSGQRNKTAFPIPSEYELTFTEPFYNVFGIEMIDAMVPSTMYAIDVFNDVIAYYSVYLGPLVSNTNDEAFYAMMSKIYSLNSKFQKLIDASKTSYMLLLDRKIRLAGNTVYTSVDDDTTIFYVVELHKIDISSAYYHRIASEQDIANDPDYIAVPFTNTDNSVTLYAIDTTFTEFDAEFLNEVSSGKYTLEVDESAGTLSITVVIIHNVDAPTYASLTSVEANPTFGSSSAMLESSAYGVVHNMYVELEQGNYDVNSFSAYVNSLLKRVVNYVVDDLTLDTSSNPFSVPADDVPVIEKTATDGTMEKQMKYKFSYVNQFVRFNLDLKRSKCKSEIGFATYTTKKNEVYGYKRISWVGGNNDVVTGLLSSDGFQYLTAPGIVNLSGTRYILLRCPEIENHLYNSFSYSRNCPGIGLFKLGSVNQITNLRFDFVNFIKKPFHPIGKLSKLTFRFETTTGELYDFKGVDHNMLISVKFYVPRLKEPKRKYLLNPNYNPNFIEYLVDRMKIHDKENDYDQGGGDDVDPREEQMRYSRLIEEQNKWDYSSEDEDDGSEESEVDITDRLRQRYI